MMSPPSIFFSVGCCGAGSQILCPSGGVLRLFFDNWNCFAVPPSDKSTAGMVKNKNVDRSTGPFCSSCSSHPAT